MKYLKFVVFLLCLLPFLLMAVNVYSDKLGANPIEALTHNSGDWALRFLLITLSVTPVRRLTGWGKMLLFRRMLGLYAFFYASLHGLVWFWLDQRFVWSSMVTDIVERPYITLGFLAFLLLLPLAATSNRFAMRRLGKRWKSLHKLVYLIGVLAVLHYLWLVKADLLEPLIYALILMALLAFRIGGRFGLPALIRKSGASR